jgi:hypothetical protein
MPAEPATLERRKKAIPGGRLAAASESAELALFLCPPTCNFMVAQVVPFASGWETTTG